MLFMQFKAGDDRYILEAKDVIEVVPFARLKQIVKAPPYIAGLLNYRGNPVPVIDVCYLMSGRLCQQKLSTRIALANYSSDKDGTICIGLLIEYLTETVRFDESDFSDSGVTLRNDPYLGRVVIDDRGIVQMVDIKKIIPVDAHDMLFNGRYSG